MSTKQLSIGGMHCGGCVTRLTKIISKHEAVSAVEVSLEKEEASFELASLAELPDIIQAIEDAGFTAREKT